MKPVLARIGGALLRLLALLLVAALGLQLYFMCRIALMAVVDPSSTTFQRSEVWRLVTQTGDLPWRQQWVPDARIAPALKRAVIAAEDAGFAEHSGVEWDAIEKAWERNQQAEVRAARQNQQAERRNARQRERGADAQPRRVQARVVGGSTITQQLAKNLFLGPERHLLRKAQEFAITLMLEVLLDKRRILEIYLNHVEWGEGVFGVEAAAQHYFRMPAARLSNWQAARLAVMLPAPKRFEKRPNSAYLNGRASTIAARMNAVDVP